MIADFYDYTQEVDDDDVISYSFLTSNESLYFVYFDPYQYVEHVGKYPNLLTLGYGFGFHRMHKGRKVWVEDPKIAATISRIVIDFIEENGTEVVLLYHCDHHDSKQRGRDKIFHEWYERSEIKKIVTKKRIEVNQIMESGKEIDLYMGYLTPNKNNNKNSVDSEFSLFAENLAIGNIKP